MAEIALTTENTVYVIYIASTPLKVWAALTSAEFTAQYFFGRLWNPIGRRASTWSLRKPDGTVDVSGVVRESDPPRKLVVRGMSSDNCDQGPARSHRFLRNRGSWRQRCSPDHDRAHPTPIPAYLLEGGRRGWPMILSGLKSLLETGKSLAIPVPQPPTKE